MWEKIDNSRPTIAFNLIVFININYGLILICLT